MRKQTAKKDPVAPHIPGKAPTYANHVINAAIHLEWALNAIPDPIVPPVWQLIYDHLDKLKQERQRTLDHYQLADTVQHNGSDPWPGPWPTDPISPELIAAFETATHGLKKWVDQLAARNADHPGVKPLQRIVVCAENLAEQIRDWLPIAPPEKKETPALAPGLRLTKAERKTRVLKIVTELGKNTAVKTIIKTMQSREIGMRPQIIRQILRELKDEGKYRGVY